MDYVLDSTVRATSIRFQILEYNDEMNKCARVEVRGCRYASKYNSLSCPVYIKIFEILQAPLFIGCKSDYEKNCDNEILFFTFLHKNPYWFALSINSFLQDILYQNLVVFITAI